LALVAYFLPLSIDYPFFPRLAPVASFPRLDRIRLYVFTHFSSLDSDDKFFRICLQLVDFARWYNDEKTKMKQILYLSIVQENYSAEHILTLQENETAIENKYQENKI